MRIHFFKSTESRFKCTPSRRGFSALDLLSLHSKTKEQASKVAFQAPICDKNLIMFSTRTCIYLILKKKTTKPMNIFCRKRVAISFIPQKFHLKSYRSYCFDFPQHVTFTYNYVTSCICHKQEFSINYLESFKEHVLFH